MPPLSMFPAFPQPLTLHLAPVQVCTDHSSHSYIPGQPERPVLPPKSRLALTKNVLCQ